MNQPTIERMKKLYDNLDSYYKRAKIYRVSDASKFECPKYEDCKSGCNTFDITRMPIIGRNYYTQGLPGILVVSMDRGTKKDGEKDGIDTREPETQETIDKWHKNTHWYKTNHFIWNLLKKVNSDITFSDATSMFAATNAVKCTTNNKNNANANRRLFNNCKVYLQEEIEIFNPDILITQGKITAESVRFALQISDESFSTCGHLSHKCKWIQFRLPSGKVCFWLDTYHPNARKELHYNKVSPGYFKCYGNIIKNKFT